MPTLTFTLDQPPFAGRTGAGVRVAVIDSGIHAMHPHVGGAQPGVRITAGGQDDDTTDRIGHGTAVAAAIREKAPGVDLVPIRVFDDALETTAAVLARAIRAALDHEARLINISMGTTNAAHRDVLQEAVDATGVAGVLIVSPQSSAGLPAWPGSLSGVVGVLADATCARDALRLATTGDRGAVFHAAGLPRPVPGVPPARNLHGPSFATANVTGFLARLIEAHPALVTLPDLQRLLTGDGRSG